jgi:hypothetical protein
MKVDVGIINELRFSNKAKARLCYEFDVSAQTVARWLCNYPDSELTRAKAIKIIAEELNIPEESILTE